MQNIESHTSTVKTKSTSDNFFEFDNSEKLLDFRFKKNNILMWTYVRVRLHSLVFFNKFGKNNTEPFEGLCSKNIVKYDSFKYGLKNIFNYLFILLKESCSFYSLEENKIILLGSDRSNEEYINGKYSNWLNDPYAKVFPKQTLIIEKSSNFKLHRPRDYNNIVLWDPIIIKARLYSKIASLFCKDTDTINQFVNHIKENFPYPLEENLYIDLAHFLRLMAGRIEIETRIWEKIFRKTKARIFVSFYGSCGEYAHIIKLAHEMGIICCEFQHAEISLWNAAYNYGDILIKNEEYKNYIPDYLLTFGKYWNNQINASIKPITIGSPKMHRKIDDYVGMKNSNKLILFASNAGYYRDIFKTIKELIMLGLDRNKIVLRPHPLDHDIMNKYYKFTQHYNIRLDLSGIVTKSLAKSYIIVTAPSTIIFEALKYNIPIFIYDLPLAKMYPKEKFIKCFRNSDELYQMIEEVEKGENYEIDFNYYFDKNWKENYSNFIKSLNISI